jgi:hypothetical protein
MRVVLRPVRRRQTVVSPVIPLLESVAYIRSKDALFGQCWPFRHPGRGRPKIADEVDDLNEKGPRSPVSPISTTTRTYVAIGARLFDARYMHGVSHRVGHSYLSREAESRWP